MVWLTPGMARFQSSFLYCINTYWKIELEVAASGSSLSFEVALVLPSRSHQTSPQGSKSSWEHSQLCHGSQLGHTRWTDPKTRSGHELGVFQHCKGPGAPPLLSESLPLARWPPGPRVSTACHPTSLTAAGFVAGALSQAHKDIARPRRIFRIGTVALETIRLQR